MPYRPKTTSTAVAYMGNMDRADQMHNLSPEAEVPRTVGEELRARTSAWWADGWWASFMGVP